MKTIYTTLILLGFALFAQAQQSTSTLTPGYWTFGINGGWAYQSSDVKAQQNGYGLGLTLGKNLYYRPGALLAFDLRGRALFTQQYGLDAQRFYDIKNNNIVNGSGSLNYLNYPAELQEPRGFIFANHKTTTAELALEGLLTLNPLRERTGVHMGLFGGIGLDWFRAKTDQADFSGKEYFEGYASLKDNQPTSLISKELQNILDGDYETIADGNGTGGSVKFMPSLGVELGYQLTPKFLVYAGHRTTFSGTDMLDGQRFENVNNDLYHYTNFGLRWTIDPQKNEPLARKPEIDIIAPFGSPYNTNSTVVTVIVDIRNVNSAADVECLVNGRSVPFDYKNGRFSVNVDVNIGNNDVIIIARNEAGQARRNVIIVYKNQIIEQPIVKAPVIRITNPNYNNYRTEESNFIIKAIIENVQSAQEVVLTVNNVDRNFDLNNINFIANITLREGENEIEIRARNSAGIDLEEIIIIRDVKIALPTVNITEPATARSETRFNMARITANINNIENKNDISFVVSGRPVYNFNYDINRSIITSNINLEKGANTVVITARNRAGEARDEATIVYQEPVIPKVPPVVTFVEPDRNASTTQMMVTVEARIQQVNNRNDLTIYFNNTRQNNFSYDTRTGKLTQALFLERGDNEYTIIAVNRDGEDRKSIIIRRMEEVIVKRPPVVRISEPFNNSETTNAWADVHARVENISNNCDINFIINGRPVYDFSYNINAKQLTARVNLIEGNNTIVIRANNPDGSDEQTVNVRYRRNLNPPRITINNPVNNSETQNEYADLRASIDNIKNRNDINIRLNNVAFYDFNFNPTTRQLTAQVGLYDGNNTIEISARNAEGSDAAVVNVRYRKIQPPIVNITNPVNNNEMTEATAQFRAKVEHVNDKNKIRLTVNGNVMSNFTFTPNRQEVTATVNLTEGNNTIRLEASNDVGKAEDLVNIRYRRAQPPTVQILEPAQHAQAEFASITLRALVETWNRRYTIKILVNGNSVSDFDYKGNELASNIPLQEGNNLIFVQASNADGNAKASVNVHYTREKTPPTVTFVTPQNGAKLKNGKIAANAIITNMSDARGVILRVNEKIVQEFELNGKNFIANVNLEPGNNILTLSAQNADGKAEASVQVMVGVLESRKPVSMVPIIEFIQPLESGTVITEKTFKFVANIRNVNAPEAISWWFNGKPIADVEFNAKAQQVSAQVDLKAGNNEVRIVAHNQAGATEAVTSVIFQPENQLIKPIITIVSITQAVSDPFKRRVGENTLVARVENVEEKNQLKILLNNEEISDFRFDSASKIVEATLKLQSGENLLLVQARNAAGTSELKKQIDY